MNLAPMTPIVVSLAISSLMVIGAKEHHRKVGQADIYKFPSVYFYLCIGASVFFASVPFWPGVTGGDGPSLIAFGTFALLPLLAAYFFRQYRLIIEGQRISVGAFRMREFTLSDIVTSELQIGRGAELKLRLSDGTQINISGLVTDFEQLAQSISEPKA